MRKKLVLATIMITTALSFTACASAESTTESKEKNMKTLFSMLAYKTLPGSIFARINPMNVLFLE